MSRMLPDSRVRSPGFWSSFACSQPILIMSMVPMSVCHAHASPAPRHGARQMLAGDSTFPFIAATTACWRSARPKSPPQSPWRARAYSSARAPSRSRSPFGKLTVRPPG